MKNSHREIKKEQWKQMARTWSSFLPPAKPSQNEIKFYGRELQKIKKENKNLKALVLGATPELRNFLLKNNIDTTIIDINPDSVKAMTSLMAKKNPKEKIIISDWLHMPFEQNSFDIVLSDSAQDNIKYSEFNTFFKNVYTTIKPDGVWFFSGIAVPHNLKLTFNNYIKFYKKNPQIFKDNRNKWLYIFQLSYNTEFYNKKFKTFDFNKIDKKIADLIEDGSLARRAMKDIGLGMDYQQVVISEPEFKKIIARKFIIQNEYKDRSHPAMKLKWTSILKPKK